jgi:hypothetical protein
MWEEIIFFRAASGVDYELLVRCYESNPPRKIEEDWDGGIFEPDGDRCWNSLTDLTQKLKVEIIDWGSDKGN